MLRCFCERRDGVGLVQILADRSELIEKSI